MLGGLKGFEVTAGHRVRVLIHKDPTFDTFLAVRNYGLAQVWVSLDEEHKVVTMLPAGESFFLPPIVVEEMTLSVIAGDRPGHVEVGTLSFPREKDAPPLGVDANPYTMLARHAADALLAKASADVAAKDRERAPCFRYKHRPVRSR